MTTRLRSEQWWNEPGNPGMTALYLERFLNSGLTTGELQGGRPVIGIAQSASDLTPCNRVHLPLKTTPCTQHRNTTTRNPGSEIFIQTTHLSHCSTSALARMRASTHETCPPKDAIHTGDWPSLHARISAHPNTALPCTCNRIPASPTQDNTPHSTTQHKHPQPQPSILIQTTHFSHCSTSAFARMRASTHET